MKKVLLFLSVIITLIWFVPNGFSMVVTAEYTELDNSTSSNQTPVQRAQSRSTTSNMCGAYPCCHYNSGETHGSTSSAGTLCTENNENSSVYCENIGNKCAWTEGSYTYEVENCVSQLSNQLYILPMYDLLKLIEQQGLSGEFDTEETMEKAKNRSYWIRKFPFNQYDCCYESIGAHVEYTNIVCRSNANPSNNIYYSDSYKNYSPEKPFCSQAGSSCFLSKDLNYAGVKATLYMCKEIFKHDIASDTTNTDMSHSLNECCRQNDVTKCQHPACNLSIEYATNVSDFNSSSTTCDSSIAEASTCIGYDSNITYCKIKSDISLDDYSACDSGASTKQPDGSLYYYGPCVINCRGSEYCIAYQNYDATDTCEKKIDSTTNGTQGFLYSDATGENSDTTCVDHEQGFKLKKLKKICNGYYTKDYCINSLNAAEGEECNDDEYKNNKSSYSYIDDGLYKCACNADIGMDIVYDTYGKDIAVDKQCSVGCYDNENTCIRTKLEWIRCPNDGSYKTISDWQTTYGEGIVDANESFNNKNTCKADCDGQDINDASCYKYSKDGIKCSDDYRTLDEWKEHSGGTTYIVDTSKEQPPTPCKVGCTDEQMGYNNDDNPDNDNTSCYKYKEDDITKAKCSTEFRTLTEWGINDTETQEKIKADTEIDPKDVCDLECKDGDDELTCKKYSQTVAKKHKTFVPCTDRIYELAKDGYHSTYCPASTTDCDIEVRKGGLNAQDFCLDEDALVEIYYGAQWYRENPNEYCATWTKGNVTEISTTTIDQSITYTDSKGTHTINKGTCECEGDGTYAYDYHTIQYWKDEVLKNDSVGQTRFDNTTEIVSNSITGFCVTDPFTDVPLNADLSTYKFAEDNKLYMSDSIKCKPDYKENNKDWCTDNYVSAYDKLGWLQDKLSGTKNEVCEKIFTHGDERNGYCDAEKLLSEYVTTYKQTIPDYKFYNGKIKYQKWLLSCESLKAEFNDAKIVDEAPLDSESITCYDKDGNEKYVPTCSKDYKKCDGHGQKEKEGSETCNFYDTPLYKECEYIGCATPSPNTAILKSQSDETSIKLDFGPDIQITQCIDNGEALQVSCNSTTHTVKCEYPYVSSSPKNWCRIADNGNLDKNSPKVYSTDIKDSCKLLYSECGKELSKGEDRLSPKQALGTTSNVFMKVTDSISECHKKYGTAAQTEMCKENGSSRIRYNCYYIDDYTYTTENCDIGNDLTIPYILKNGVKHWNKCNCAPTYKYHFGSCSKPSGNKCVQKEVTEEFLRDRNISNLPLGTKNVELYTSCNAPDTQASCSGETWVDCYYCCPTNMKVTGKTKQINGKKKYECVCK